MSLTESDINRIRSFYSEARGRLARRLLQRRLRAIWGDVKGRRVLGLGYASPYLRMFMEEAERVFALVPAKEGVNVAWPTDEKNLVALTQTSNLPLEGASIDRVLMVHGLENAHHMNDMLREVWRVMSGEGRLLLVVPNRTGLWSRNESTPFGHGRPFSLDQIRSILDRSLFDIESAGRALYVPPFRSRMFLSTAGVWERTGALTLPALGGVNIVEAKKRLYAASPLPEAVVSWKTAKAATTGG